MYNNDNRIVMTLDAGGTNFVFSAIQGNQEIVDPVCKSAPVKDLTLCLDVLTAGFEQITWRNRGFT